MNIVSVDGDDDGFFISPFNRYRLSHNLGSAVSISKSVGVFGLIKIGDATNDKAILCIPILGFYDMSILRRRGFYIPCINELSSELPAV